MIVRVIEVYQRWISPVLHSISSVSGACRFQPTCSEYAAVAIERHGALKGLALALWRLLRCNPFSRGGFDPVPVVRRSAGRSAKASPGIMEGTGNTAPSAAPESGAPLEPLRHG